MFVIQRKTGPQPAGLFLHVGKNDEFQIPLKDSSSRWFFLSIESQHRLVKVYSGKLKNHLL
jgi:hypothetical protein